MVHKKDLFVEELHAPQGPAQDIGCDELKAVARVESEYESQSSISFRSAVADTEEILGSEIPRRQGPRSLDREICVMGLDGRSAVRASKAA